MKINTIGHLVKTNPIQTQSNPISEKPKMNANAFSQKDYENKTAFRPKKTNPNKPNLICSRLKIPVCEQLSSFTIIAYDFTRGNLLP